MSKFSYIFLFSVLVAFIFTFYSRVNKPAPIEPPAPPIAEEPVYLPPEEILKIPTATLVNNEVGDFEPIEMTVEENLFGSFYGGRAEYFIVDQPTQLLHGSTIQSITYSYLDGALYRCNYLLSENISNALIKKYGSYQIKAYDDKDKEVMKNQLLYEYNNGKKVLNKSLRNYELIWEIDDTLIKMRVNLRSSGRPYTYVEQLTGYQKYFKNIEHFSF